MIPLHLLVSRLESPSEENPEFLFCARCQDVHRVSALDRAPVYDLDGTAQATDDLRTFLFRHAEHALTVLRRASDVEVHTHARHDPMCQVSWEVADELQHRYVVTCGRDDVESPRRYTLRSGRLVPVAETIGIDAVCLQSVIDEALYPHVAPASKLEWLVEACRVRVSEAPWDAFEPIDEDRDDPNTHLACLPGPIASLLAVEALGVFGGDEGERVAELLRQELRFQIPVVRMRRRYVVEAG